MNSAIKKAKDSVAVFLNHLAKKKSPQTLFSIKKPYPTDRGVEHIWIDVSSYDGSHLHGTIGNTPVNIRNLKAGDQVAVLPSEISDWMILEDGKIAGGYTLRVIMSRMTPKERLEFGRNIEFID